MNEVNMIYKNKLVNIWLPTSYNDNCINVIFTIKYLHLTIKMKIKKGIIIIK